MCFDNWPQLTVHRIWRNQSVLTDLSEKNHSYEEKAGSRAISIPVSWAARSLLEESCPVFSSGIDYHFADRSWEQNCLRLLHHPVGSKMAARGQQIPQLGHHGHPQWPVQSWQPPDAVHGWWRHSHKVSLFQSLSLCICLSFVCSLSAHLSCCGYSIFILYWRLFICSHRWRYFVVWKCWCSFSIFGENEKLYCIYMYICRTDMTITWPLFFVLPWTVITITWPLFFVLPWRTVMMINWPLFFVLPSFNSLQRWHDVCLNTPFAVQEVLFAWEHMALPVEKVKVRNLVAFFISIF